MITLRLLGLDRVISVGECGVLRDPRGWIFSEDLGSVDPVLKIHYLDDAYLKGDPDFVGRPTVPAIADVTTGAIVQNEACPSSYCSYSSTVGGLVPTRLISPPDVKIETTFFSEKIFQHHTMQLPSKTAQKKNL